MEALFSKVSEPSYTWLWKSPRRGLRWSTLWASHSESLFVVMFQEITIDDSEGACVGVCF